MKYAFSLLVIFILFENISSLTDYQRYKLGRFALTLRKLKQHKEEEKRKLQEDLEDTSKIELSTKNLIEGGEVNYANDPNKEVPPDTPCSETKPPIRYKKVTIQITYIFSFTIVETIRIYFGGIFFIYQRVITTTIIIRLRITYYIPYRALQDSEENADTVKAVCSLVDESLKGKEFDSGMNVLYNCNAETVNGKDATKAKIRLNTDIDLLYKNDTTGKYEAISFDNINFNGNSSNQVDNIQEQTRKTQINFLDGEVIYKIGKYLEIQGTMEPLNSVKLNDKFNISMLISDENGEKTLQPYECKVTQLSPSVLDCDISSPKFNSSVYDLHLSSGISVSNSDSFLILNMKNWENNTDPIIYTGVNSIRYRTNSGGLSGGAIAGIVIACVIVLAAASIAALLLKRRKTNREDNTTIVGLNTLDI